MPSLMASANTHSKQQSQVRWRFVLKCAVVLGVAFGLIVYFGMDPAARYLTQSVGGHAAHHPYLETVRFKMASMAAGVGAISMLLIGVNQALH